MLAAACLALSMLPASAYGMEYNLPIGEAAVPESVEEAFDSAMLLDVSTNTVLYSKDEGLAFSPTGGAVQLMSAYVVASEAEWDREIPVIDQVDDLSSSVRQIGMDPSSGERWVIKDLVAAMMLHGAQDAALVLSDHVSGSEEAYLDLMNRYAGELGMAGTVYADALGSYDRDQTSTVSDLMLLCRAALANDDLKEVITAGSYIAMNGRQIQSRMYIMDEDSSTYDPRVQGIGEGSTSNSGANTLFYMVHEGLEWMFVGYTEDDSTRDNERAAKELFDHFIAAYSHVDVAPYAEELLLEASIAHESGAVVTPSVQPEELLLTVERAAAQGMSANSGALTLGELPELSGVPQVGEEIGAVTLFYNGQGVADVPLLAEEVVAPAAAGMLMVDENGEGGIPIYSAQDWLAMQKPQTFVGQYGFYIVTVGVIALAAVVLLVGHAIRRRMR